MLQSAIRYLRKKPATLQTKRSLELEMFKIMKGDWKKWKKIYFYTVYFC